MVYRVLLWAWYVVQCACIRKYYCPEQVSCITDRVTCMVPNSCSRLFRKWNGECKLIGTFSSEGAYCSCVLQVPVCGHCGSYRREDIEEIGRIIRGENMDNSTSTPLTTLNDSVCLAENGCQYFYVDLKSSYNDSRAYCQYNLGTDLATINTDDDVQAALAIIAGRSAPWIGLHSTRHSGWFEWEDNYEGLYECPQLLSGECIDFWQYGHHRNVTDQYGRTEWDDNYEGDGYSFVIFTSDGKADNNVPGHEMRPFLCNGVVPPLLPPEPPQQCPQTTTMYTTIDSKSFQNVPIDSKLIHSQSNLVVIFIMYTCCLMYV